MSGRDARGTPDGVPDGVPGGGMPAALREAAARAAARPQRPLRAPAVRAAFVVAAGLGALAVFLGLHGMRGNAASLGALQMMLPAALRIAAGAALVALALREAVPGRAVPAWWRTAAFVAVPLLLALLAEWLDHAAGGPEPALAPLVCFPISMAIAVPAIGLFAWLLARAYPLRPVSAASLGALGTGLLADAAQHLGCSATSWMHTLCVHGGALATLTLLAAALGWAESRRRAARLG